MNSDRWDNHFLELALVNARMSKDPSTKVGAVIVGPDREIRSTGFNGFPRGIADTPERLNDRDAKLKLVVHGEMNAVLMVDRGRSIDQEDSMRELAHASLTLRRLYFAIAPNGEEYWNDERVNDPDAAADAIDRYLAGDEFPWAPVLVPSCDEGGKK